MITTLYLIAAITITLSTYLKTQKISRLSSHPGIRLINSSFLFFAIYFTISFLFSSSNLPFSKLAILSSLASPIQTYLITIASLYLAASLFWKDKKKDKTPLHTIALIVVILTAQPLIPNSNLLELTLIVIYAYTSITAYTNYQVKKTPFSQIYLIAIALLLTSNILTLINSAIITAQAMTLTAFAIFLYGTLKTIK